LEVRVVPFSSPGYPAIGGSYHLLTFASPTLPPLVWLENISSTELIDDAIRVNEYGLAHAGTVAASLSKHETLGLIKQLVKETS